MMFPFSTSLSLFHFLCPLVVSRPPSPLFVWYLFHSFLPYVNLHHAETQESGEMREYKTFCFAFISKARAALLNFNFGFEVLKLTLNGAGLMSMHLCMRDCLRVGVITNGAFLWNPCVSLSR